MYIEALRLRGFKSFADSFDMPLLSGLTVVVGPNGAGKSNVVDGLRWIGGESSAKRVRGRELEDLIFSGTKERMPLAGMEVGVVVAGVDREKLRVFGDDVEQEQSRVDLVRRLERDKGSSYRVNGKEVLKREADIFLGDIAFGGSALSIVGQGLVSDIVNVGGARRRKILEATSGLQGLRERYLDAGMRLQGVETNLEKLEEYEAIFNQQIAELEEQAKRVRKYRSHSAQIRSIALYSVARGIKETTLQQTKLEIEASEQRTKEIRLSRDLHEAEQTADTLHKQIKALRSVKEERFADEREVRFALRSLEMKEEQARAEKHRQKEEKQTLINDSLREKQELEQAETNIAAITAAVSLWEGKRSELSHLAKKRADLQALRKEVQKIEQSYEEAHGELTALVKEKEKRQELLAFSKRRLHESTLLFNKVKQAHNAASEVRNSLPDSADMIAEQAYLREQLQETEEQITLAEEEKEAVVLQIKETQNLFNKNKKEQQCLLQDIRDRLMNADVEKKTLQRVLDGEVQADDAILDETDVQKGYELAVDALWGKRLLSGKITTDMQKQNWQGRGWRSDWKKRDISSVNLEGVTPLLNFVKVPDIVEQSLSKVGVVDSVEQGFQLQTQLQQGEALVTKDGSIWYWDGYVKIVSADKKDDSLLALKKRCEELQAQSQSLLAEEASSRARIEKTQQAFEEQLQVLQKSAAKQEQHIQKAQLKRDEQVAELDDIETALRDIQRRHELAKLDEKQKEETSSRAKVALEREREVFKEHEMLCQALPDSKDKAQRLEELKAKRQRMAGDYEKENNALREVERESAALNEKLALLSRDLSEWEGRLSRAKDRLAELDSRHRALEKLYEKTIENPQGIDAEKQKLLKEIERQVGLCNEVEQNLLKAEVEERAKQDTLRSIERALSKVKEDLAVLGAKKEMLDAEEQRLQALKAEKEKEHKALGAAYDNEQEQKWQKNWQERNYEELQEQQKRLEALRERMGGVNLLAEQELQAKRGEQEERLLQIKDIRDSAVLLKRSQQELESEATDRFVETFAKVNRFFSENFRHVFGGGSARLLLSDPGDVLHSEVDVELNLPGKRVKHLSLLSGGEQTLVALCLLFAMFRTYKAPLYVLDEVDAALDDVNVGNFCELLQQHVRLWGMRFLIVSHHRLTMASADKLFGVTMVEKGVSKLVSVDLVDALEYQAEKTTQKKQKERENQ